MIMNKKEYYGSLYVPGNWREGVKSPTLRIQIKQVMDRKRTGALQEPYETTAVAVIELLDKADGVLDATMREMNLMAEQAGDVKNRIKELEASLKAAQEEVQTLRSKNATVQPQVANNLPKKPVSHTTSSAGRKGTKP